MKNYTLTAFLLLSFCFSFAQMIDPQEMGQVTLDELKMKFYEKDSTASAVVLKEEYFTYYNPSKKNSFTKYFYVRMKILKKNGYKHAALSIPFLKSSRLKDVEAITYNLDSNGQIAKTEVEEKDVLKEKYSKDIKIKTFAMPNVKIGSVIEYKFTLKHSGGYGIFDWTVQSDIPKIKSIYKAHLPVDLRSRMIGYVIPTVKDIYLKKKCLGNNGCNFAHFEFDHVPPFVEEKYLTSKWNYITRLSFERQYYRTDIKGPNREWRALDSYFKKYYEKEMNNASFLKKQLPSEILNETDNTLKAKKIFSFIQDHFTVSSSADGNLIKDYNARAAGAQNINISLYNAFKAGGIANTQLALLSTRKNGFVTDFHPSITDFNYVLVRLELNGKVYLLDATDKNLPFGIIPFNCLTNKVRVLDYVNGSRWEKVKPYKNNSVKTRVNIEIDDEGNITGKKSITRNGYEALLTRKLINKYSSQDEYLESEESRYPVFEIDNYTNTYLKDENKPLKEEFELVSEETSSIKIGKLLGLLTQNPFQLKDRKYPVDYGYKRKGTFLLNIKIPDNYQLRSIPENKVYTLPGNDASYIFKVSQIENNLSIYIKSQINKTVFLNSEYQQLKDYYRKIVELQNMELEFIKK